MISASGNLESFRKSLAVRSAVVHVPRLGAGERMEVMSLAKHTKPFDDQKPGTSGLRRRTSRFMLDHYVENFLQSIFDSLEGIAGSCLVIGGDGRYFNDVAVRRAIRMASANGFSRVIVGRGGLLSTPAASHLIRKRGALGGLIFSASHNPGGESGDFGVKFNQSNGAPASESLMDRVHSNSLRIESFRIVDEDSPDLSRAGVFRLGEMDVEIIDPVSDYADLMESLFDFDAISDLFSSGFRLVMDSMNAVTGPYARAILEDRLGASAGTVINSVPLADFGGVHPDPNRIHASHLHSMAMGIDSPDMLAACDGDGDRNLILGSGVFVSPSDSLAILAANMSLVRGYSSGVCGIARSIATSSAADRVASFLGVPLYETPVGWKFFANLLDDGKVTICGEESAGTGSDHVREKDGLWAILLWLNVIARRGGLSIRGIADDHWRRFGRDYYLRCDYEGLDSESASRLMREFAGELDSLRGESFAGLTVSDSGNFRYVDPVDGSVSSDQGLHLRFGPNGSDGRAAFRLSGTGTEGAALRVYVERHEGDSSKLSLDPRSVLSDLLRAASLAAGIERRLGPGVSGAIA